MEENPRMGTFAGASAQCKGALGRKALLSDRGLSCTIKLESDIELRCHSANKFLKVLKCPFGFFWASALIQHDGCLRPALNCGERRLGENGGHALPSTIVKDLCRLSIHFVRPILLKYFEEGVVPSQSGGKHARAWELQSPCEEGREAKRFEGKGP